MSEAHQIPLVPGAQITLMIQRGPHVGQKFTFSKSKVAIGRSPENDIILINDPLISRQHAYIEVHNHEVDIVNLSQKNQILVNGESVSKWKLTNQTVFTLGDTEFMIYIDFGQSVVAIRPQADVADELPTGIFQESPHPEATRAIQGNESTSPAVENFSEHAVIPSSRPNISSKPIPSSMNKPRPQLKVIKNGGPPMSPTIVGPATSTARPNAFTPSASPYRTARSQSLFDHPRFRFYALVLLVFGAGAYWLFSAGPKKNPAKPTLKYNDVTAIKMNAAAEIEKDRKRQIISQQRATPAYLRLQENVLKGMREFQLGNFTRAQEHFQFVLREQPNHPVAQRYNYLSKVRFDEVLKSKIILGQKYYAANNFKLCASLFQQVKDMLQGKPNDNNLKLADQMYKKCGDAIEGIR